MKSTDTPPRGSWQFAIDRGGTFTDVVAWRPDGTLIVHKLLSENPDRYQDAVLQGIRDVLALETGDGIPAEGIASVKIGTTVATNALLEGTGDRTVLVITKGFGDALRIGYQNRPDIFARRIAPPEVRYERTVEVDERMSATGEELHPVDLAAARASLQAAYDDGLRACAIVFLHGYRYPEHELQVAVTAREVGFTQVSVSHDVSPLMRLVSRGDTTVVDAYLSPLLLRYLARVQEGLPGTRVMFMQSNGGLANAAAFRAKNSILSGPAGGVIGAAQAGRAAGFDRIISFDMGGTSTDVAHYAGEYERALETEIAGVRMRTPIMAVHTVAAGGGSVLHFDGARYRVGPDSAGAHPGPACYRKGGPLTITDANVMVGKILPELFPRVFGPRGDLPLDVEVVRQGFADLAAQVERRAGGSQTPEGVAEGFLAIAVENMTNAIKRISVHQGHDVSKYTLCSFGGAGGQHACRIADALGMSRVLIHPYAGVLSAYGIGLADLRTTRHRVIEARLCAAAAQGLTEVLDALAGEVAEELTRQGVEGPQLQVVRQAHLRYEGTDSPLLVGYADGVSMRRCFEELHRQRYGFAMPERALVVEAVSVEAIGHVAAPVEMVAERTRSGPPVPAAVTQVYTAAAWRDTPVFLRRGLEPGDLVRGPAIIAEETGANMVEPGWQADVTERLHLVLTRAEPRAATVDLGTRADPATLEVFHGLFRTITEQMGATLQNTSHSVNIKERLDFSCAIFDSDGSLVAAAHHIPVHLGAMSESVRSLLARHRGALRPGDVYITNSPFRGGTHLPDITAITPVFDQAGREILFFAASRGHHADIGGITPGSMPPASRTAAEEGVLIDAFHLVANGRIREGELRNLLSSGPYPARNPEQNLADLRAQIAANERGLQELRRAVAHFSLQTVRAYMKHVQANAAGSVRGALCALAADHQPRPFVCELDDGHHIRVAVELDGERGTARIDFSGTSSQHPANFNAPPAVCRAAVIYVMRTLVDDDIPLNEGCLEPLEIIIPEGSMLNPRPPAAVAAGNVETSQLIVDALYGALGVLAGSQGTMNNVTFGNAQCQYYETICGGTGAGRSFDGADAVHSHMTNTRLTDPEVLEWRYPVLLEEFSIRRGSGGRGRHRGGDGVVRRIRFREPMEVAVLSGRRRVAPHGLHGGEPGAAGRNRLVRASRAVVDLGGTAATRVEAGDVLAIETPGGGGYGEASP
jgi:5-oxoprolinase (ATP-hydrolysing)